MSNITISLAIIAFAALVHAGFQLSASLLTLISGHSLSVKRSQFRIFRLTSSFIYGTVTMLIFALSFLIVALYNLQAILENTVIIWSGLAILAIVVGVAVWLTYYRTGKGTELWIPRELATFLTDRTTKTKRSVEAFTLGSSSVLGEAIFLIAPLGVAAYALLHLPSSWILLAILMYTIIAMLPLLIIWTLVSYQVKISRIQAWRERNKRFLQHITAAALIILSAFIYSYQIAGVV